MNVQLQCVYGGGPTNLSVFKRREIHKHRRRIALQFILIALVVFAVMICYSRFDTHLAQQETSGNIHQACIATSIAAIENSSGF